MRAVRCVEGAIRVLDVPAPSGDGVPVRIRSAGICGSDLHMIAAGFPLPRTLGHEMAGLLPDGTAVAVEPLLPCGTCPACADGDYNLCALGPTTVIGVAHDGGMAEQLTVPERCLVPLASGVRPEDACLVEPLAVAVHGLRRARFRDGGRVAVIGGGAIGLAAVAALRGRAEAVALHARHDAQRAAGERLGAVAGGEDGFPLVIDAAGTSASLAQAVELCAPGGTLLLLATYWDGKLELPAFPVTLKEVSVVPASMYGRAGEQRDIDDAAAVLARDPEIPRALITHRFPLDAAAEAFAVAADRRAGAIKVVLEP